MSVTRASNSLARASIPARVCNLAFSYLTSWRETSNVICVLGPHRSGTSAITRVLNLMGVYLGAGGDLIPPRPDNPVGFWEHSGLIHINERILKVFTGATTPGSVPWRVQPMLPARWETSRELRGISRRADLMLRMHFGRASLWGWKDPRTCLTLPFWQRLMPRLSYVVCLRNPTDVARSLHQRDSLPIESGYALWLRYLSDALQGAQAERRIVVCYESLMRNPDREVERLAVFLGRSEPTDSQVKAAVRSSLDPELWHNQDPFAAEKGQAPPAVQSLFEVLSHEAQEGR